MNQTCCYILLVHGQIFLSSRTSKHAYHALIFISIFVIWHMIWVCARKPSYNTHMQINPFLSWIQYAKYLCQQALYWFDNAIYTQCTRKLYRNAAILHNIQKETNKNNNDKFGLFRWEWKMTATPACIMRITYNSWKWHKYTFTTT